MFRWYLLDDLTFLPQFKDCRDDWRPKRHRYEHLLRTCAIGRCTVVVGMKWEIRVKKHCQSLAVFCHVRLQVKINTV